MSNILIVHAHHEGQSFSRSMARTATEALAAQGHQVVFSDLHAMNFQPVSDRRNFTTVAHPDYLKQQPEEAYATEHQGFSPEIEAEIRKLEACDLLIFSFPVWWFGLPAMLKGWVDRVFAYKRIYSRGKWYENGAGQGKRAMVLMTTGGSEAKYGPGGLHATIKTVLDPIHRGIFWFNGFSPLPPFVAWEAAHGSDGDRHIVLENLRARMQEVLVEPVIELPHAADFDATTAIDTVPHFMVTITRTRPTDAAYEKHLPEEISYLETLQRQGKLLSLQVSPFKTDLKDWRCFLLMRERGEDQVRRLCEALPLASYLNFQITQLEVSQAM